jgi:hypothetical protein
VVLDPILEQGAGLMLLLASLRRDDFVGFLLDRATDRIPVGSGRQPVSS